MSFTVLITKNDNHQVALPAVRWLTLEHLLYALALAAAIGMRFFTLGAQPLNALEAANVWPAWLNAWGLESAVGAAAPTPNSPFFYTLYSLLFSLGGAGDAMARWLPALCGVGLVGLFWWWRDYLGRTTALAAALLAALDAWLTAFSRLADSAMLSLFLGMLALTAIAYVDVLAGSQTGRVPRASPWHSVTAISIGLLLVSGPLAWSWAPVLLLFAWLRPFVALPDAEVAEEEKPVQTIALPALRLPVTNWLIGLALALMAATGWLARPNGLGLISTSLSTWFVQLTGVTGEAAGAGYSLGWVWVRLIVDQPFLLVFGLGGLWLLWRSPQNRWATFLSLWFLWGLLLAMAPGRSPFALVMLGLPLLFLAAHTIDRLLTLYNPYWPWRESLILLGVLAILSISFAFWATAMIASVTFELALARTMAIILLLALLLMVAFAFWTERDQAYFVLVSFVGALLLFRALSGSWQLNQQADLVAPDGFFQKYTNPDVRRLATAVQLLSAQRHGDSGQMPLQVEMRGMPDPLLGWYLRDMRNLTWVLAPGAMQGQSPPVVITLSEESATGLATSYLGSRYAVHVDWLPRQLFGERTQPVLQPDQGWWAQQQTRLNLYWTERARPFLRWAFYRKVTGAPIGEPVILWVATSSSE